MCELGFFFPIFLEKDLLKVDKILGLTFFQARKDFEGFKTAFFHLLLLSFVVDGLFTTPVYSPSGELSVSWHEKSGPKTKFIYDKQIWKQMFAEILRFK